MLLFRRLHPLPILLLLAGILAAVYPLARRYRAESRDRAVELVMDFNQVRFLSSATGHSLDEGLRSARASGAAGIAVTEQLLGDMASAGRVRVGETTTRAAGGPRVSVTIAEPELFARVREHLGHRLPQLAQPGETPAGRSVVVSGPGRAQFAVPNAGWQDLIGMPIGLDPAETGAVRAVGLDLVGRVYNFLGATPPSIGWALGEARAQGVRTVIFAGEDVLGFQRRLGDTAAALAAGDMFYGQVEFGKQRGDEALAQRVQDRLIRVHSIAAGETGRLEEDEAIERYSRAVGERNIRLCYVRLMGTVSEDTYRDSWDYVRKIKEEVKGSGFVLGPAHPLDEVDGPTLARRLADALIGAGIGAAALLLLASLFPISDRRQLVLTLLFAALGAGALAAGGHKGRQLAALGAALVFPTLAFVWVPQPVGAFAGERRRWPRAPVAQALRQFAVMSAISGLGALFVAATLSQRAYMLKVESFAGIKAAHVLPLLGVAAFYLLGLSNRGGWAQERERISRRASGFLAEPLQLLHLAAMLVGLVALSVLVLRTCNDPGLGVSPLEMKFRALLEQHLVRPRTKEFLIGHPALLIGLAMAATPRWSRWALPLLLVGAIGQASIVNSFCHIHTPLVTSAWRTFNGLWLGALLGLVACAFGALIERWWSAPSTDAGAD
jgi:Family of unknown function (DUF5693)